MTKHIELKKVNQETALATGTLALPPLVIEGLEEFKGSFDRLCLHAGTAAIEAMVAADAEQLCGKRYQRHAERQGHRWGVVDSENATSVTPSGRVIAGAWSIVRLVGTAARLPSGGLGCGGAAVPNWSFPVGRQSKRRTC
jgi:hypothetical protein